MRRENGSEEDKIGVSVEAAQVIHKHIFVFFFQRFRGSNLRDENKAACGSNN